MSVYQINDCNMMKFTRQKDSNICENVVTRQEKTGEKRAIFLLVGDGSAWFWLVRFKVWLYQFSFWYWKRKKKEEKKNALALLHVCKNQSLVLVGTQSRAATVPFKNSVGRNLFCT